LRMAHRMLSRAYWPGRVAVSGTDHVTGGKERARCSNQLFSCSCFPLSPPLPPAPSQWQNPHSGHEQETEDNLLKQTTPLMMMRMVTLNKTLYVAFSSPLPQKHVVLIPNLQYARSQLELLLESREANMAVVGVLTALAFALRFYKINHPDQVVFVSLAYIHLLPPVSPLPHPSFDEVHFGKFAAYYILREYYFDVHPPFAKLLFGLAGWFVGFDGQFNFENIGDNYTENHVPYVGMRALPAILGSLTVPIVYGIMKESGYGTVIAAFSASIVLFGMYGYISATIRLSVYFQTTRTLPSHASFYWTLHSSSSFLSPCIPTFVSVSCDICMSKFPSHYPELC
jgi:Dolichyl-phosphate-mannose-protein mannosyltransferase